MRRRLFALVSAVSLLLCLGTVALSLAPYRQWPDSVGTDPFFFLSFGLGSVRANIQRAASSPTVSPPDNQAAAFANWERAIPSGPILRLFGFEVARDPMFQGAYYADGHYRLTHFGTRLSIAAPSWAVVLLLLLLPGLWSLLGWRRHVRCQRRYCHKCSYSLTGNTSGVCPECGTPVPKEPAEKSPRPA